MFGEDYKVRIMLFNCVVRAIMSCQYMSCYISESLEMGKAGRNRKNTIEVFKMVTGIRQKYIVLEETKRDEQWLEAVIRCQEKNRMIEDKVSKVKCISDREMRER